MASTPSPIRVLLWGGQSMARVIEAMLREQALGEPTVIFDETLARPGFATRTDFLHDPRELKGRWSELTHFVVCIGAEHGYARFETARALEGLGLRPLAVQHPTSILDPAARIGSGSQIMPGAIVHKFVQVGRQVLLNTGCTVDHECVLGDGVHVMGNAAIAGRVRIGNFASIGTNATVLPGLRIGKGAIIGAGAVVTKDVAPHAVVVGVPAKVVRKQPPKFLCAALDRLRASALPA